MVWLVVKSNRLRRLEMNGAVATAVVGRSRGGGSLESCADGWCEASLVVGMQYEDGFNGRKDVEDGS